jgi:hypothetical protein
MNLQELTEHVHAGRVDELNLISIEGGIYLLEVRHSGRTQPLNDAQGKAVRLRSVEHARTYLEQVPLVPFHLVHASAHDEMCGLGSRAEEPLKVPISLRSALYR